MSDETDLEVGDYGFEPAVAGPAAKPAIGREGRPARRAGLRRRLGASAILLGALASMGGAYAAFATSSGASNTTTSAQDIAAGRQLFETSCITCHGTNLEGIPGQGLSLIGVGGAATYFQVSTGRMPVAQQGAYEPRREAKYTERQVEQLAAYVQSVGGGPNIPRGNLRVNSSVQIAQGGQLFRLNCASCHGATFRGAPLSAGKQAPSLYNSTDKQIYTAMLTGPENMPVFNDNEITPAEKHQIVTYIQMLKASKDPGGEGIARIGPVSEAVVIWVGGVGGLMIAILWIGARNR